MIRSHCLGLGDGTPAARGKNAFHFNHKPAMPVPKRTALVTRRVTKLSFGTRRNEAIDVIDRLETGAAPLASPRNKGAQTPSRPVFAFRPLDQAAGLLNQL